MGVRDVEVTRREHGEGRRAVWRMVGTRVLSVWDGERRTMVRTEMGVRGEEQEGSVVRMENEASAEGWKETDAAGRGEEGGMHGVSAGAR